MRIGTSCKFQAFQPVRFTVFRLSKKIRAALISTGVAAFWALPLMAQEFAPAATGLESITVTSQRRTESLPSVPSSVGVVGGSKLESFHIDNLANLQEISPSLIVTQTASLTTGNLTIRGIGTSVTDVSYEQSVGVYIDGVYRGRPGAALQDLMDVNQIEILRGPQSTLFGRNNTAGAINISTKLPDTSKFGFRGAVTFGNFSARELRAAINVPLIEDTLAFNFAVTRSKRDGTIYAPNLPDGDLNSKDRESIRAQFYWTPSSETQLRVIADQSRMNDRCCAYLPLFMASTDGAFAGGKNTTLTALTNGLVNPLLLPSYPASTPYQQGTPGTSPSNPAISGVYGKPFDRVSSQNNPTTSHSLDNGLSVEANHQFGDKTMTVLAATRKNESLNSLDLTGVNSQGVVLNSVPQTAIKEKSLEVRLQNATGSTIEYIVGAHHFDQNITYQRLITSVFPIADQNGLAYIYPGGPYAALVPYRDGVLATFWPTAYQVNSTAEIKTDSNAIFGQIGYGLPLSLKATIGLRYLDESKSTLVLVGSPNILARPLPETKSSTSAWMGTAALSYLPDASHGYYIRYSRGYKSGATNTLFQDQTSLDNPTVKPETTDAFEAGAKYRLLDNRLSANFALFSQTVNDQQVQVFKDGYFLSQNVGKIRVNGIESEIDYQPAKSLTLTVGGALLDSRYLDFVGAPQYAGGGTGANALLPSQDLSGHTTQNAPKLTLVFGVAHKAALSDSVQLTTTVSLRHATSYFTDLSNTPAFENGDTNFLDGSLTFALQSGVSIQLWGRNLNNQSAYSSGITNPAGSTPIQGSLPTTKGSLSAFVNDPRTYGVTVSYKFR